jgi:hypothetical protein
VCFIGKCKIDGQLRAVRAAIDAGELKPFLKTIKPHTIRVHGAMQVHGGQTSSVRFQNASDKLGIFYVGKTLIMNDDIKIFRPIRIIVNADSMIGRAVTFMDQ